MINTSDFAALLSANGIELDEKAIATLDGFADYLVAENEKYNLTAIKTPEAIMLRHFCDSLSPVKYIKSDAKLLDIGSGAGFPSVPIAVSRPDVSVTALDATAKKAAFINSAAATLGIGNITAVSGRAEELAHKPEYTEKFDVVTARAVSALRILCELSAQYLRVGGILIALKGEETATTAEIAEAKRTADAVGLTLRETVKLTLKDEKTGETLSRTLVIMKKTRVTPRAYPRRYAQILKSSI